MLLVNFTFLFHYLNGMCVCSLGHKVSKVLLSCSALNFKVCFLHHNVNLLILTSFIYFH